MCQGIKPWDDCARDALAILRAFFQTFISRGSMKLSGGDDRVTGGHESTREAPSERGIWGGGVPLPSMGVRGCYPRENSL